MQITTPEHKIKGISNETWTVGEIDYMEGRPNSRAKLIESGKEPVIYIMERVIEGTRKQEKTALAYRFKGTDTFISVI